MSDDLPRLVGEMNGKLDLLIDSFRDYRESHDARHRVIDQQVQQARDDINQAKGAKAALLLIAGALGAAVAFVVDLFKGG